MTSSPIVVSLLYDCLYKIEWMVLLCYTCITYVEGISISRRNQIDSTVVKMFACQADGLGFNSPSGYKVGRPGHSKYVWVGQYEPSCLKFPSSILEDKL